LHAKSTTVLFNDAKKSHFAFHSIPYYSRPGIGIAPSTMVMQVRMDAHGQYCMQECSSAVAHLVTRSCIRSADDTTRTASLQFQPAVARELLTAAAPHRREQVNEAPPIRSYVIAAALRPSLHNSWEEEEEDEEMRYDCTKRDEPQAERRRKSAKLRRMTMGGRRQLHDIEVPLPRLRHCRTERHQPTPPHYSSFSISTCIS
jgi:hypothetical protein